MDILDAKHVNTLRGAASFTLRNRLYRVAWSLVWALFASWTPTPYFFGWRRMLLIAFGAEMAPTARVYPSVRVWSPANLRMGEYTTLGPGVIAYSMGRITLEPFALVSQHAYLCTGTHDTEDANFQLKTRPIVVGARAWVAAEAFVGPGVTIGRGAILGARACAFRDLEPWKIYLGNPASVFRERRIRFHDCTD